MTNHLILSFDSKPNFSNLTISSLFGLDDNLKDKLDVNSIKKILDDSKLLVFRNIENDGINYV